MADFFIEGNYREVLDCGEYVIAISNLMHLWLGLLRIIRIDKNYKTMTLYDSRTNGLCLEYIGYYKNERGIVIMTSGHTDNLQSQDGMLPHRPKTILFQITNYGDCFIEKEWDISIDSPNSFVYLNGTVYFGQNKQVTLLNTTSGETEFYTNKSEEELSALEPIH